jgi:hypothetical protein
MPQTVSARYLSRLLIAPWPTDAKPVSAAILRKVSPDTGIGLTLYYMYIEYIYIYIYIYIYLALELCMTELLLAVAQSRDFSVWVGWTHLQASVKLCNKLSAGRTCHCLDLFSLDYRNVFSPLLHFHTMLYTRSATQSSIDSPAAQSQQSKCIIHLA